MAGQLRLWAYLATAALVCLHRAEAGCHIGQVAIRDGRYSFWYGAAYEPPAGCSRGNVMVSKLYLQGACVSTQDNRFGGRLPDCSGQGGSVTNTTASCEAVFAEGPSDALVNLADLSLGDAFDEDTVCTTQLYGYFFVESNCTGADQTYFRYQTSAYSGGLCWDGRSVSRGAVAGTAVACFIIFFFIILGALAFVRRRQRAVHSVPLASTIHLQPYPQQDPYGGLPTSYGQAASSSSGQQNFNPYDDKPVTGIPVGNYGPRI